MANYDKQEFEEYLSTKVAESTAKIYATDMVVCVKALEQIKLYEGKELSEILEDFVSHKKAVKNYLQEEFLKALTEVGSNDSGLYDSLTSKAKHYLVMDAKSDNNTSESSPGSTIKIKLTGTDDEYEDEWIDDKNIYTVDIAIDTSNIIEFLSKLGEDDKFKQSVFSNWVESRFEYVYIHYIEVENVPYIYTVDEDDLNEAEQPMDDLYDEMIEHSKMKIDRDSKSIWMANL